MQSLPSPQTLSTSIRDLTHKIQNNVMVASIPPLFDSPVSESALVSNAIEATESPKRLVETASKMSDSKLKIFDQISQQDFDDAILYKSRPRKRYNGSSGSLTSNSSGEQEVNVAKPTLMTMSTVGVLPDLRSAEKIKSDIEDKEKMLADILCFDRVKMSNVDLNKSPIVTEVSIYKTSRVH